jgi:DNA replication protein DnaC
MRRTPFVLIAATLDKLRTLNLGGMARALAEQIENADYHVLSFDERLGLLVDREAQDRDNRRLERHLKAAKLRWDASVEDVEFRHPRGLDRGQFLSLADARWVGAHQNILVTGPTASGKTFIACALAHATVRRGHTALYLRAPRLLGDLALARADGRLPRVLAAWARVDVLVVDDFALRPLLPEQTADLLEVIEDRAGRRSTIIASQLPVRLWHEALTEATLADALLDRVIHTAHRIELRGESLRRSRDSPKNDADAAPDRPGVADYAADQDHQGGATGEQG